MMNVCIEYLHFYAEKFNYVYIYHIYVKIYMKVYIINIYTHIIYINICIIYKSYKYMRVCVHVSNDDCSFK